MLQMPKNAIILTPVKRLIAQSVSDGKTQSTVAKEFGVSRDVVSRLMMVMKMQKKSILL